MRVGISGENVLPTLDHFTVTETERPDVPVGYWEAMHMAFMAAETLTEPGIEYPEDD